MIEQQLEALKSVEPKDRRAAARHIIELMLEQRQLTAHGNLGIDLAVLGDMFDGTDSEEQAAILAEFILRARLFLHEPTEVDWPIPDIEALDMFLDKCARWLMTTSMDPRQRSRAVEHIIRARMPYHLGKRRG